MPQRLLILIASLALTPAGCVLPHTLEWEIDWAEPGLADRAVAVEARILEGGCTGGSVVWSGESGRDGLGWETPPDLDAGRYGFAARSRDVHCRWFATGCREVDLPGDNDDRLRVVLATAQAEEACAEDLCIAGQCACTAPGSCGAACVGPDCTCSGGECALWCTDGGDCACAGGGCAMRCDLGAECTCTGGDCVMDCAAGSTCTCVAGDCTMECAASATCTCLAGGCS